MKATPELLQQALRVLEIGLSTEISAKILATVRLLDEKGAEANLMDFALIEATYSEKIESESIDLTKVEINDLIEFANTESRVIKDFSSNTEQDAYVIVFDNDEYGYFLANGKCTYMSKDEDARLSEYDIVKIIKPNKPQ